MRLRTPLRIGNAADKPARPSSINSPHRSKFRLRTRLRAFVLVLSFQCSVVKFWPTRLLYPCRLLRLIRGLHEKFPPRQDDCVFKVKSLTFSSFATEHWTASQHSVRLRVLLSDPQQFDIHGTCHGGLARTRS